LDSKLSSDKTVCENPEEIIPKTPIMNNSIEGNILLFFGAEKNIACWDYDIRFRDDKITFCRLIMYFIGKNVNFYVFIFFLMYTQS